MICIFKLIIINQLNNNIIKRISNNKIKHEDKWSERNKILRYIKL